MSHIFDALQRSESENSGIEVQPSLSAAELLERAEIRAASQSASETLDEESFRPVFAKEHIPFEVRNLLTGGGGVDPFVPVEHPGHKEHRDILTQFRTLDISIAPLSRLVSLTEKDSPAAEAFRLLGVRLKHRRRERPLKKLLVTSTIPREGKSFAAANLACAIASGNPQRTLLLDGDLRRPTLSRMFGLGPTPGICDWLQGECNLTSAIYRLEAPGIWILPAGNAPAKHFDLVQSAQLPALMEELCASFDWIIIDSPPVLPLADTSVWARLADGVLLVTRQGTTEKHKLQKGIEALDPNKLIGAILNSSNNPINKDCYYYHSSAEVPEKMEANLD